MFVAFSYADAAGKPKAADLVKDGQTIELKQEKYTKLFEELRTQYNFPQKELDQMFAGVTIFRKVLVLMDKQWEAKPYYKYWPLFITPSVIKTGQDKFIKHKANIDRIEK
jgi:membrane-bound lytic murein transglycosylase B